MDESVDLVKGGRIPYRIVETASCRYHGDFNDCFATW